MSTASQALIAFGILATSSKDHSPTFRNESHRIPVTIKRQITTTLPPKRRIPNGPLTVLCRFKFCHPLFTEQPTPSLSGSPTQLQLKATDRRFRSKRLLDAALHRSNTFTHSALATR